MDERASVEVRTEPFESAVAQDLVSGFEEDIASRYPGWTPTGVGPSASAQDFQPPGGNFLVAYVGDEPAGCAGLKRLAADTVEIKRVFVRAEARGLGVARALLEGAEQT